MNESLRQNSKFEDPLFRQLRSVVLQISIHEKSLPIFLTNKKHTALSFTSFKKTSQNKRNFSNFSKDCYFLLGCCRNVNFGLF